MKNKTTHIPFRHRVREIMEPYQGGADATLLSLFVDLFIIVCIVISCILVFLDPILPEYESLLWCLELIFTGIFVIEYLFRWYAAPNRWIYPFTFYALIDLIAILPTLMTLSADLLMLRVFRGARLLRLLRLIRLLRLLRLLRYGYLIYRGIVYIKIWMDSVQEEYRLHQLGRLFFICFCTWLIGANLLYLTENKLFGYQGPFYDYWNAYWNIIIVLVSGIEDKEPVSLLGRIEITFILIAGICFIGMITGEIVSIIAEKIQRAGKVTLKPPRSKLNEHIIIIGNNSHLDNVILQVNTALKKRYHILIISEIAHKLRISKPDLYTNVFALTGNPLHPITLEKADLKEALRVIILSNAMDSPDDRDNHTLMQVLAVFHCNKNIPIIVELQSDQKLIYAAPLPSIDFMVSRHYGEMLTSQAILNPGITFIYDALMNFSDDSSEFYILPVPKELYGKTFMDAQNHFLELEEAIVLIGMHCKNDPPDKTFFHIAPLAPEARSTASRMPLEMGDQLVVIAYEHPILFTNNQKKLQEDIWKGKVLYRDQNAAIPMLPKKRFVEWTGYMKKYPMKEDDDASQSGHVIICNCNEKVPVIVEELLNGSPVPLDIILIIQDTALWEQNPSWHPHVAAPSTLKLINGCPADEHILQQADIQAARSAVILSDPNHGAYADGPSTLTAMAIEKQNPWVYTIMELIRSMNRSHLESNMVDEVVCMGDISEKLLAQGCITPGVMKIFNLLLTTKTGTPQIFLPALPESLKGLTFKTIAQKAIATNAPLIMIGFVQNAIKLESELKPQTHTLETKWRDEKPTFKLKKIMHRKFVMNPLSQGEPGKNTVLTTNDQLIVMAFALPNLEDLLG